MPTMFLGMVLVDPGLQSAPGQDFDQIRILKTFVTTNRDNLIALDDSMTTTQFIVWTIVFYTLTV